MVGARQKKHHKINFSEDTELEFDAAGVSLELQPEVHPVKLHRIPVKEKIENVDIAKIVMHETPLRRKKTEIVKSVSLEELPVVGPVFSTKGALAFGIFFGALIFSIPLLLFEFRAAGIREKELERSTASGSSESFYTHEQLETEKYVYINGRPYRYQPDHTYIVDGQKIYYREAGK